MPDREPTPVFLIGKKVNLRPVHRSDVPTLTRWINDPEIRQFMVNDFPFTEKQEEAWYEKIGANDESIVLIIETKAGIMIGCMGLHEINWRDRVATTGALIGEKSYQDKGLGTDAKMALLDYAFNTLNLRKICSRVTAFNKRSLQYSLHCGYKVEGTRRQHIFKKGQYWDIIELALFKEDWLPHWKKFQAAK